MKIAQDIDHGKIRFSQTIDQPPRPWPQPRDRPIDNVLAQCHVKIMRIDAFHLPFAVGVLGIIGYPVQNIAQCLGYLKRQQNPFCVSQPFTSSSVEDNRARRLWNHLHEGPVIEPKRIARHHSPRHTVRQCGRLVHTGPHLFPGPNP